MLSTPPAFILSQDQTLIKSLIPSELLWLLVLKKFSFSVYLVKRFMFVSEIFLDSSSRNHFKNPLEFSGLFYCSVFKELIRRCFSDLISISCLLRCVKNFFKKLLKFFFINIRTQPSGFQAVGLKFLFSFSAYPLARTSYILTYSQGFVNNFLRIFSFF